jgi:hypothetical protein
MMPEDMENYVSELARVAAPGATLFVTFFLLNEESRRLVGQGLSTQDFRHEGKGYVTVNPKMPEAAVAFPEDYILDLLRSRGFAVRTPVRYGSWCGRKEFLSYQDIVIADRLPR